MATLLGLMVLLLLGAGCSFRGGDSGDSVVLVMVDTLRADHLGCYGYDRDTSPNLDRLAESGVLFENFYSVAPWTNPAIATLFTGRYPRAVFPPLPHKKAIGIPLPSQLPTLAERLQEGGYRTVALVDHPGINPELRFDQGFDEWHSLFLDGGFDSWTVTESDFVLDQFLASLDELGAQKFFLYLHLVYPHRPYAPPPPYDSMFGPSSPKTGRARRQEMINAYDGEVRYTDELIGRIAEDLEGRDLRTSWSNPADFEALRWLFLASPHSKDVEAAAVIRGDLKFIDRLPWRKARPALFDLAEDPAEKHNLAEDSPRTTEMSRRLKAHLKQSEQQRSSLLSEDAVELDEEVLDRLRALGYLQ